MAPLDSTSNSQIRWLEKREAELAGSSVRVCLTVWLIELDEMSRTDVDGTGLKGLIERNCD